jgi:oligosaccharide repeat unit polymerase
MIYYYVYLTLFTIYISFMAQRGRVLQINLSNVFILAHILLFFITPILFQQFYFFENIIFSNVSYISFIAIVFAFMFRINFLNNTYFAPRVKLMKLFFYIFIAITIYKVITGLSQFGVDRTANALANEYEGRGFIDVVLVFLNIFVMFYFAYLYKNKKRQFYILYLLYFISLILTSAHRTPVAIAFVAPILLYIIYNKEGRVTLLKLSLSVIFLVNIMFFMNFFRQGIIDKMTFTGESAVTTAFLNTLSGINTTKNLFTLIETEHKIEYFEKIHYMIIGFIPRKLYPEKPVVSFNVRTTEKVFGYKIGDFKGADVITYTVPGEGYIQFSYFGVFLLTFLAVLLSRILLIFYLKFQYSDLLIITFVFSVFINFRSAFDSFYYSVVYSILFLIFLIPFFKVKRGRIKQDMSLLNNNISFKFRKN